MNAAAESAAVVEAEAAVAVAVFEAGLVVPQI